MQVCRICLEENIKMYEMKRCKLDLLYEKLTGFIMNEPDKLPQMMCWQCSHNLLKYNRFRNKALRSHNLMMEILHTNCYLSQKSIKSIDRQSHALTSTLTLETYDINHKDLHLYDTTPLILEEKEEKIQDTMLELDLEVKNEELTAGDDNEMLQEEKTEDNLSDNISTSSSDIVLAKHVKKKFRNKTEMPNVIKRNRKRKPAAEVLTKDIFTVTDLTVEEQMLEILKRKDTANYKRSSYQCTYCYKGFLDEDTYNTHMIRHTSQSGVHECEICKVRFKTSHALQNHLTAHMQKFSCKNCPYVTTRRHAAKLHEDYHSGTKYQCPHCESDFSKFTTYMSHLRIKHPSDFVCYFCGHSFVSAKGLAQHHKLKHPFDKAVVPQDGPYCDQCEVRFASQEAIETHMKLSARHNDKETKQNIRKRRTENDAEGKRDKKNQLKRIKPDSDPIPCEQCEMQLPDSLSYYRHFRRAHPDKNRTTFPSTKVRCMCEVCGKMFQSLALLQDHSFTHSESKQFRCPVCGKHFQRRYRLIAHRRVHGAPRVPHACAVCGKTFSSTSNMQRHMVSHTGLKPFKCEMCGKCFKHASEKRVHITYVHLKKPWPKRSRGKRRSDGRQVPLPQQPAELDIVQPLWPACSEPKTISVHDKSIYYNLKI